jgi:two-component system, sensor histidine kinase and response regulator
LIGNILMKRFMLLAICSFCVIIFCSIRVDGAESLAFRKKILVLQSYSPVYPWSANIEKGIYEEFLDSKYRDAEIVIEYLDTKRIMDEAYFEKIAQVLSYKYANYKYDLIIVVDDDALNFLNGKGKQLFPGTPLVFCGMNEPPELRKIKRPATGLTENIMPLATLRAAMRIQPEATNVLVIYDTTTAGKAFYRQAKKEFTDAKLPLDIKYSSNLSLQQMCEYLAGKDMRTIVILFAFTRDGAGKNYDLNTAVKILTKSANTPIYGYWDYIIADNGLGGMVVSARQHGKEAARLAIRILNGEKASSIPVTSGRGNQYIFNWNAMLRFDISPLVLPEDSYIVNRARSFYGRYKRRVWAAIFLFFVETLFIAALLFLYRRNISVNKKLSAREEDLRVTLNSIGDGVIVTDPDGLVHRMNPVAETLTGWSSEEAENMPVTEVFKLIDTYSRQPIENPVEKAMKTGKTAIMAAHAVLVARDGSEYQVADSASPIRNLDENIRGVVMVFRDITEEYNQQQRIKEYQTTMQLAIKSASLQVWEYLPANQQLTLGEREFQRITDEDEVRPLSLKEWLQYLNEEDGKNVMAQLEACETGLSDSYKCDYQTWSDIDGEEQWWHMAGQVVERDAENRPRRLIGVTKDVTAERSAWNALEDASRAKSAFLANMSHEIRTPMNGILGSLDFFEKDNLNEEQLELLNIISLSGKHLLQLINDILDISRVEARMLQLSLAPFNTKEFFSDITKNIHILSVGKGFEAKFEQVGEAPEAVIGDCVRIRQILINLIGNAAKFTHEGYVCFRVISEMVGDDLCKLIFEIEDTGIGIPEAQIGNIFEKFQQVDRPGTPNYEGTGLGLAICKELTALMHGTISVRSRVGKGSCFLLEIELPVGARVEAKKAKKMATLDNNVLLVEDNHFNQKIAKLALEKLNCQVSMMDNGEDAVQYIKDGNKPDFILMDCQMPGMDGFEATKLIREIDQDILIIALTADARLETRDECFSAGMNDHITKPFKLDELIEIVTRHQDEK